MRYHEARPPLTMSTREIAERQAARRDAQKKTPGAMAGLVSLGGVLSGPM